MKGRNTWRSHQWINRGHVHCLMTWVNALAAKKLCSIFTINILMSGCRLYITQSQEIQSALYFWNAISLQHIVKMGTGPEIHIVQLFRWNTLFATHLHSTAHEWGQLNMIMCHFWTAANNNSMSSSNYTERTNYDCESSNAITTD